MVETSQKVSASKKNRSVRGRRILCLVAIAAIVVAVGFVYALWHPRIDDLPVAEKTPSALPRGIGDLEANQQMPAVTKDRLVDDDGQTLWQSPTHGGPISLRYLPLGTQVVLHLRPSDLLAHREGEKVLAALGPFGQHAVEEIEKSLGLPLRQILELTAAIFSRRDGRLDYGLRATLVTSSTDDQLAQRLPNAIAKTRGDQTFFVDQRRALFMPRSANGSTCVSCPLDIVDELIDRGEAPILLSRDFERLLARTDDERIATLVLPTKFLRASGRKLFTDGGEPLRVAFEYLVGEPATAVALSAHWADNFFFELQTITTLDRRPHRVAAALKKHLGEAPSQVEADLLASPPHSYGHRVVAQFPAMLQQLSRYTRNGEERGVSLTRVYLPASAGHNLLMAAELLTSRPGSK